MIGSLKIFLFQLFTPLDYLRIQLRYKWVFDYLFPLVLSTLIFSVLYFSPINVKLLGTEGLIFVVTDLVKILVGFYIASLAAIATFPRKEMDECLSGNPAKLKVIRSGKEKIIELSRRRFLCYMFGYLALMGLVVYFVGALVSLLSVNFLHVIPIEFHNMSRWLFIGFYIFLVSNLFVTTLLGLHFMTDRIHRS